MDPVYVARTSDVLTDAEADAWYQARSLDADAAGAWLKRWGVQDGVRVLEGWPLGTVDTDLGALRFQE
jgi:hypothetical protein